MRLYFAQYLQRTIYTRAINCPAFLLSSALYFPCLPAGKAERAEGKAGRSVFDAYNDFARDIQRAWKFSCGQKGHFA